MNKRIKELEKQCYERVYADMCDDYDVVFDKKKFAELIVRECIEIVEPCKCGCSCDQEVVIANSIIAGIKEHFGVEE